MGFKELVGNIIDKMKGRKQEDADLPDDVTRDNYLRSLRRQRRVQMEYLEKKQLLNDIKEFERERTREEVFGVNGNEMHLISQKDSNKKLNMLKKKRDLMVKNMFMKQEKARKQRPKRPKGFLDRGII